ncbi:MAG: Asp-tRNA(Asn)/Glu-tRNA(Gln) amidotransferase subunit GatA [Gammaproteobacteria bacterium]|jgi:aspartyl-tRNA(Asn)/glutamyl-tRNA(Gln) amidotransferase subunit A|nr:Asp-tRNA(Asn)/Glu-tRNA(Gln) amidotransferase subunit GatA [Gammaproteobacteria bacterium]MBT6042794.1 Asp-tRNA(Asn)/Glu-tRNA(Gln) amidotransferase subunit GatA [Gammaproteobacteria bacterium]
MINLGLAQISRALGSGEFSSVELTQKYLQEIAKQNSDLNAYITVCDELALSQAQAADEARSQGNAGPMTGIPIAHKDLFCTQGIRTSCGSKMLDNFIAPYNATVVENFINAGTVTLGKTNMDEFAMGSSNETSFYGPVKNPWNRDLVPGGSSGGSAAAVSGRLCAGATATDTGGSIRQPASFTGITGLKPTYGRVSRWGMVAFASSLDQAGTMTQTAEDAAMMLNVMAGVDPKDSTSSDRPAEDYTADIDKPLTGLKIGLPVQHFSEGLDATVEQCIRDAVAEFEKLGATVKEISLPNSHLSVSAYYVIAPAEASANLSRYDGVRYGYRCENPVNLEDMYKRTRSEGFGTEVKRRIMVGTYALSAGYYDAYYIKAQKIRRLIKNDFEKAFQEVDVIMGPTSPHTAFAIGSKNDDPVTMYLEDIYTIAVNLAGLPGISIPAGLLNGLPIGLQIVGKDFAESQLLNVAHKFQQATDWHEKSPV